MRDLLRRLWEPSAPTPADAAPDAGASGQVPDVPGNAGGPSAIEAELVAWVRALSRGRVAQVDLDAVLLDKGYLDSLTAVEFLARIEQTYGVRVPERRLSGPRGTLRALAEELSRAPRA